MVFIGLTGVCYASAPTQATAPQDSTAFSESLVGKNRALVAVRSGDGVCLSWRLLNSDAVDGSFDVYRLTDRKTWERMTESPLEQQTWYRDPTIDPKKKYRYAIQVHHAGKESLRLKDSWQIDYHPSDGNYLSIPTQFPDGYHANDAAVGDLDGDGQMEIVVHVSGRGRDNSQAGLTDPASLFAYRLDGTKLWEIHLGKNCREGAHYLPFLVYDLDLDGKAELICRTADGTRDGLGQILGDPDADWRVLPPKNQDDSETNGRRRRRGNPLVGKIVSGPEYLTVFDGRTGAVRDSAPFLPRRAPNTDNPSAREQKAIWGDDYGNRMDRFLATIAYLDGKSPAVIMSRGYYEKTVLVASQFYNGQLQKIWEFDSDQQGPPNSDNPWRGQGNHSISVADIDSDGRDEILFGAMAIDDNGRGIYSTGLGHGDAQHTTDLDPERPGLETWSIHENDRPDAEFVGAELRDSRTGEILFVTQRGRDVARGLAADINPEHAGAELWGGSGQLFDCRGNAIGRCPRSTNMAIWWDGDRLRELANGVTITKWDYQKQRETVLLEGRSQGLASNNGSKANPCLIADFLGDWREELIARTRDNRELRIYVSDHPTSVRLPWLMLDRQYRLGVAWQNVGYNQPAHPSFFLGVNPSTESR